MTHLQLAQGVPDVRVPGHAKERPGRQGPHPLNGSCRSRLACGWDPGGWKQKEARFSRSIILYMAGMTWDLRM